jgi:uncharacterized membrane protein
VAFGLGFVILLAAAYVLYCAVFKGLGYPEPYYAEYHMAWFAYILPISASVLVFLVVLIAMFKMSGKGVGKGVEKGVDKDPVDIEKAVRIIGKLTDSGQP